MTAAIDAVRERRKRRRPAGAARAAAEAPQSIAPADLVVVRTTLLSRHTGEGRYLWLG
jgi:hypothetical protein